MRGNMKFIGHLFLRQLLSAKVIGSVICCLAMFQRAIYVGQDPLKRRGFLPKVFFLKKNRVLDVMATNHWKFISSFHPSLVETQKSSHLHPSPSPPPQGELVLCEQVDDLPEEHALECACELLLAIGPGARNGSRERCSPWCHGHWTLGKGRIAIQLDGNCMKEVLACLIMFYLLFPSWKMVVNLPHRAYYAHFFGGFQFMMVE